MQKINSIIPFLFLTSFCLQAAMEVQVEGGNSGSPGSTAVTETVGQGLIARTLQDDIVFEREKRQLSNELALEKLRAELQKVRGGGEMDATMPMVPPPMPMVVHDEPTAPPSVVLVSQVAGVSRVGVAINGQLRFVSRNETFPANGKIYRLESAKNNQLIAKEVK